MPASANFTPSRPSDVAVLIITYGESRVNHTIRCIESVLDQSYQPEEIHVLVEGTAPFNLLSKRFEIDPIVHVHEQVEEYSGLARVRNEVTLFASGDVYVFIDDDATADPDWLNRIVNAYDSETPAVGGDALPQWETTAPWSLPPSFYWLVGVTHEGFSDGSEEVRNTFGCNLSVRAEVFEELGGFDESFGKTYGHNLQGEEPEFGARMKKAYGRGFKHAPEATVHHHVTREQTRFSWLLNRSYWQGVSKAQMDGDTIDTEWSYLSWIVFDQFPKHIIRGFRNPREWGHLVGLVSFTSAVGVGYLSGRIKNLF